MSNFNIYLMESFVIQCMKTVECSLEFYVLRPKANVKI
jgi:hypothetical protein